MNTVADKIMIEWAGVQGFDNLRGHLRMIVEKHTEPLQQQVAIGRRSARQT